METACKDVVRENYDYRKYYREFVMIKHYERKLLNQLLQGQVLKINRNGYYFRFWYDKAENKLYHEVESYKGCSNMNYTTDVFPYNLPLEERIVEEIKFDIEHHTHPICLQINSKSYYLQKDKGFKRVTWFDADRYCKKADLNLEKIIEKEKKIKICNRTIVKVWSDGEYNIKKEVKNESKKDI